MSGVAAPAIEIDHGDCLDVLRGRAGGFADLAYLDPPFNTGRRHRAARGDYEDCWPDMGAYLEFLRARVEAVHRALKPDGSILLHCDWRACHHIRLMLDEVFGAERFVNHLVWSYGLGGSSPRRFARKHDDILFYARGAAYYFEPPRVPATSARMRGQTKKATDVIDIPTINNMAAERVGYPTQKPLALLELLVRACCPPGGVVLDPFCGSGTTLAATATLDRGALGIDVRSEAVEIARARIEESP
ncbi:MAG: site-specific DNA-methyltransferase [Planctomycetes bacterium]|nr:site-specific DNA-methyltransferase [Planctomycetota bacterium]